MSQRDWFGGSGGAESGGPGGGPAGPRPPMPRLTLRRRGPLAPTLAILAVIIVAVTLLAQLWTEVLWYDSVGFTKVFWVELLTKTGLFVVGAVLTAAIVASSLLIGYRTRPVYPPVSAEQQNLDHYRELLEPLRRLATIAAPAVLGIFAGSAAASQWQTFLLWFNRVPFGSKDAQFGLDIGFFVFTLPWLRFIVGFLTMALVLGTLAAAVTHYVYGGLQLQTKGERTTTAARIHLSLLLAALVLVRAASWWLDRYSLTTKDSRLITGLTYTDEHAVLPTKAILAVAGVMCAALFVATIWTHSWRLPGRRGRAAGGVRGRRRRHLSGAGPELQGPAVREVPRGALHRSQHQGHQGGLRTGRYAGQDVSGLHHAHPGSAAQRRGHHPGHPSGRPERGVPDVQTAAGSQVLLPVPRRARRRPLHDQRQG